MKLPWWWDRRWGRSDRDRARLEGLLESGYVLPPPSVSGGSRNFDAVDDAVERVDDAGLDVVDSDSMILQVACKLDAVASANRTPVAKKRSSAASHAGYKIHMTTSEVVGVYVSDAVDSVNVGSQTMAAGTWYGLAGAMKAVAAANDDVSFYVDGALQAGPTNSTVMGSLANAIKFRAGADGLDASPSNFWDGDIAYVRFYKKEGAAWTAQELDDIVQSWRFLTLPAPVPYLKLEWAFRETDATPATTPDLSGNGFTGTYIGTADAADPSGYQEGRPLPPMYEVIDQRTYLRM